MSTQGRYLIIREDDGLTPAQAVGSSVRGDSSLLRLDKIDGSYHTLLTAIASVPVEYRVNGLTITFRSANDENEMWQFEGTPLDFSNIQLWRRYLKDEDLEFIHL